jgi:hypothetical protein
MVAYSGLATGGNVLQESSISVERQALSAIFELFALAAKVEGKDSNSQKQNHQEGSRQGSGLAMNSPAQQKPQCSQDSKHEHDKR